MKSEIARSTKFVPVKLEVIFESAFELSDFIGRLKADNHLPSTVEGLILQLEAFQFALSIPDASPSPSRVEKDMGAWAVKNIKTGFFMGSDAWYKRVEDALHFNDAQEATDNFTNLRYKNVQHLTPWTINDVFSVRV